MKNMLKTLLPLILIFFIICGCASLSEFPEPLTYVALEIPEGPINTQECAPCRIKRARGGWYFLNFNFRPAPDCEEYLSAPDSNILGNVDIQFRVPFAIDILFFGYGKTTDTIVFSKTQE